MNTALLVLTLFTPLTASAAEETETVKRSIVPPLRLETGVAFRPGLLATPMVEGAIQLGRGRAWAVEAQVSFSGERPLLIPGPQRGIHDLVSAGVSVPFEAGRWLRVGPTLEFAYRTFRQQFSTIDDAFVPQVGVRANFVVLGARRWSLVVTSGVEVDLMRTDLVLETAEVRALSPVEGRLGLRFNFGHGRVPAAR